MCGIASTGTPRQRSSFWQLFPPEGEIVVVHCNPLERNAEEGDSVPFSRDVGIERDVLFRCAVFRRRERIEHLKRIAAADRAWNHAGNFWLGEVRGPVSLARMMPGFKRSGMREGGGGITCGPRWLT